MERNIITISGPSAVGKSFFVDSIKVNFPNIREIVGLTTRPIREGEINGKSGIFMTIPEMNELEANNKLVLVKEFFGNKYAWYKDDLTNSDECRIVNISYNSIQELLDMKLNIYSIFIKPGSEEKLKELLKNRSLTEEEFEKRITGYYESMDFLNRSRNLFNLVFTNNYDNSSKEKMLSIFQGILSEDNTNNKHVNKLVLK